MDERAVILANGDFPVHGIPLRILMEARHLICCDGSAGDLISAGVIPEAIVGDLDSIEKAIADRYPDRIFSDNDQETNDLTKSVKWCLRNGYRDLIILGATGRREDHTVGNISLLAEYAREANVEMVTNTGTFIPYLKSCIVPSHKGQPVSVFCIDPENEISSSGLKYPLRRLKLKNWWMATLNEATGDSFTLTFNGGPVIVYRKFA